jgi:Copper type II ascorbate-dependent monooxygenase, C-terminal domain
MTRKSMLGAVLFGVAIGACGKGGSSSPSSTITVTLPEWQVPAGTVMLKCMYQNLHNPEPVNVQDFLTTQGEGGHHLIAFLSSQSLPDGTIVDCSSAQSMVSFSALLFQMTKAGFELPKGYAVQVPANAEIVWQSHYINASTSEITTHDTIQIQTVPLDPAPVLVGTYAFTELNFDVPAGQMGSTSIDCAVPFDMTGFTLMGHMHQWGQRITIQDGPTVDNMQLLYDIDDWQPAYQNTPPYDQWPFDAPFEIHGGDNLRLSCTWDNTQGTTDLTFPTEMCAGVFWFFPATQSPICSD